MGALENLVLIAGGPSEQVGIARTVADQATLLHELAEEIHGGQPVPFRQGRDPASVTEQYRVSQDDEGLCGCFADAVECALQGISSRNLDRMELQAQRSRRGFQLLELDLSLRICGKQQRRDRGRRRSDLLEQLKPLAGKVRRGDAETGGVPAGSRQTVDQPGRYRVADYRHDYWNGGRRVLERLGGRRPARDDRVELETYQFASQLRQPIGPVVPPPPLDGDGPTFHIAELVQALHQGLGTNRE